MTQSKTLDTGSDGMEDRATARKESGWEALEWERANGGTDWNVWGPKGSNHLGNPDLQGDFGSEKDAKLIAASKELFEAAGDLIALIDEIAPNFSECPVMAYARAAILKATSTPASGRSYP